ncbi:hypothetical protein LCGC14_1949820 [marine sediment metagenome]|uniref:Uncharacterized protein n=1 Tax=marine sediment metagenome TaxID=412755 RepID=A0A0F9IET1_9ZZZZ
MEDKTIIQVSKKTVERLKKLKITRFDTYDEIINRMLDKNDKISQ